MLSEPRIVYEGKHFLAVAKPFGMPSQTDPSGDPSLVEWASHYLGKEAKLLHRLDRPTGGLVLIGKSDRGTREISKLFETRLIRKTYLAVIEGAPPAEVLELEHFVGKLPGKNFVRAYDKNVRGSKPAKMTISQSRTASGLSLLEIHPTTGRRHQIRAQLAAVKLSILGDFKYGKCKTELPYPGLALWASRLELEFAGETMDFVAQPPPVFPWDQF